MKTLTVRLALFAAALLLCASCYVRFSHGDDARDAAVTDSRVDGARSDGTPDGSVWIDGSPDGQACHDNDGDGVTDCDGDCDDDDPTSFPGASEICGDERDNDCNGTADPNSLCQGLGTFVSDLTGDDQTGTGTQRNPVQTINKGINNAELIGNGADVYVAHGDYDEKITLVEGVSLFGGFQCDANACTWERDVSQQDTIIANVDVEGVLAGPTITRATRVDGFVIMGLSGSLPAMGATAGLTIQNGTPTIANNAIQGGNVPSCVSWCQTAGILLRGTSNHAGGVLITGNTIHGGVSDRSTQAISLRGPDTPVAEIVGNTIFGGAGSWTRAVEAWSAGVGTTIVDNDIYAGDQTGTDSGSSFAVLISGTVLVDSNRINAVPSLVGSCPDPSPTFWCGGLESEGAIATITNNVIFGMSAPLSAAVYLSDGEVPFGAIVLNANTLDGYGSVGPSGLSAAIACRTVMGTNAQVGRIRNNILLGGRADVRVGFFEDDQTNGRTCEPVAYEHNDIYFRSQAGSTDITHRQWTGAGVSVELATVTEVNGLAYAADNFTTDPQLDSTFHLQPGSPCIDNGTSTEAPANDMDGEARPQGNGVDVGADEAQ